MQQLILNLAKPTPKDVNFYRRWEEIGEITTDSDRWEEATILVCDWTSLIKFPQADFSHFNCVVSVTTGTEHLDHIKEAKILCLKGERDFLIGIRGVSEWCMLRILSHLEETNENMMDTTIGLIGSKSRIATHLKGVIQEMGGTYLGWDIGMPREKLYTLIYASDIISVHLALSSENRGFFDQSLIHMLGKTYILNSARRELFEKTPSNNNYCDDFSKNNGRDLIFDCTEHIAGSKFGDRVRTDVFMVAKVKRFLEKLKPNKLKEMVQECP